MATKQEKIIREEVFVSSDGTEFNSELSALFYEDKNVKGCNKCSGTGLYKQWDQEHKHKETHKCENCGGFGYLIKKWTAPNCTYSKLIKK